MKLASYLIVRGFKYNIKYSVYFQGKIWFNYDGRDNCYDEKAHVYCLVYA